MAKCQLSGHTAEGKGGRAAGRKHRSSQDQTTTQAQAFESLTGTARDFSRGRECVTSPVGNYSGGKQQHFRETAKEILVLPSTFPNKGSTEPGRDLILLFITTQKKYVHLVHSSEQFPTTINGQSVKHGLGFTPQQVPVSCSLYTRVAKTILPQGAHLCCH